jgi:hypothetical protein
MPKYRGKNGAPIGNKNAKKTTETTETTFHNDNDNLNLNLNENLNENEFALPENPKSPETPSNSQSFPTANAVDPQTDFVDQPEYPEETPSPPKIAPPKKDIVPTATSPPKKGRRIELTPEQMQLYHAARVCFESSERSKAMIYQDRETTSREMFHLKTIVARCSKIAPDMSADFLKNVLEHFRVMTNGKLKDKAVFTPRALITPWIWEQVIDSLPAHENDPEIQEIIKGLFK